jgi:hypothetical protein
MRVEVMSVTVYQNKRKRRSDYGVVKINERDLSVFRWIGEQYAVSVDHVGEILSGKSESKERIKGDVLSERAVRWILNRWKKGGWVEVRKLIVGQPTWVWLTQKGLREVSLSYRYQEPSLGKLNHYWHVNAVRLHVEKRKGTAFSWVSERKVNQRLKTRKGRHIVDGEVLYGETTIATEIELEQKSKRRLRAILWNLKSEYDAVWYFAAETCYAALTAAVQSVDRKQNTFVVYRLNDILT